MAYIRGSNDNDRHPYELVGTPYGDLIEGLGGDDQIFSLGSQRSVTQAPGS